MKVSSCAKPISSPSRTEKFPPPLMRFLKSNAGSKSRGRSRASPMFIRRKNAPIQEPSSPKVTCIGQVRVRRSCNKSGRAPAKKRGRCWWVRKTLLISKKLKPKSIRPFFCKWVCFFRFGYCGKSNNTEDSSKIKSNLRDEYRYQETEDEQQEQIQDLKNTKVLPLPLASPACLTPPKNALLLTRCRSAPYRFSSMENEILVSNSNDELKEGFREEEEDKEIERPICENEEKSRDSREESRIEEESNEKSSKSKVNGRSSADNIGRLKEEGLGLPLILTRCKSEPASRTEMLNPGYV